ncbi:MAG: 30S ribosomal protein S8 [Candidatus Komeilibacteria bacterium]
MTVTDPIADMLARLRNAQAVKKDEVLIPWSKLKYGILKVFVKENYIKDVRVEEQNGFKVLIATLGYVQGQPAFKHIRRMSKPSRRIYVKGNSIPYILNGLGMAVISTSKGLKTDNEARRAKIGGELICEIW